MSKEHTVKLLSPNADSEEEYEQFRELETAIARDGFAKAYVEVVPQNGSQDVRDMTEDLKRRFRSYSVQIFVRDKGRGNYMILVIARKRDANISGKMEKQLGKYVYNNFMGQNPAKSVDNRSVEPREF